MQWWKREKEGKGGNWINKQNIRKKKHSNPSDKVDQLTEF